MEQKFPKCVTGWSPYGVCSCCHFSGVSCCIACAEKDDCNSVCGWMIERKTGLEEIPRQARNDTGGNE